MPPSSMNLKRLLWLLLGFGLVALWVHQANQAPDRVSASRDATTVPYSKFRALAESGAFRSVLVRPSSGQVEGTLSEAVAPSAPSGAKTPASPLPTAVPPKGPPGEAAPVVDALPGVDLAPLDVPERGVVRTIAPPGAEELLAVLGAQESTQIEVVPPERPSVWTSLLMMLLPVLVLVGVMIYLSRRASRGGPSERAIGFAKNKAQAVDPSANTVRLSDVAGCEESKLELAEVVEFLRRPDDFIRVGAKAPKGVLMVGPPGTGKTLLARAVAGEAGVPFFAVSGSEFVEMFVGVGASRVRSLFDEVKARAPAIVFIDEIDAVGRQRSGGSAMGGSDEREQTLNQLLIEMDGFQSNSGVVVIAATNRADVLDPALRRPGRFDREVHVALPDKRGRAEILALHARTVPMDVNVNWDVVARGTPGFSGADLANLINEAALLAAREHAKTVTAQHLDLARDKILMGTERKGGMINARERTIVAYHEAGHAIVAHHLDGASPVHKITILPRGQALGVTMQLPEEDRYNHDETALRATIAVLMGGRAAEEVALQTRTVGASNDFSRATSLARRMVGVWGMTELGPISFHGEEGESTSFGRTNPWSQVWLQRVDDVASAMLRDEYANAVAVLQKHRALLEDVAQALLRDETVDSDQFLALVAARAT